MISSVCLVVSEQKQHQADCFYLKYWFICSLVLVLFLSNLNLNFLFVSIISVRFSTYMVWYRNRATPHLAPPHPTAQEIRIPIERYRRLINWRVYSVVGGDALKGTELGKELGKGKVKDNPVSEVDFQHSMLL